jgi:hypothetical protein
MGHLLWLFLQQRNLTFSPDIYHVFGNSPFELENGTEITPIDEKTFQIAQPESASRGNCEWEAFSHAHRANFGPLSQYPAPTNSNLAVVGERSEQQKQAPGATLGRAR